MTYKTIRAKIKQKTKHETKPQCHCGKRLNPRTTYTFRNFYNEVQPICQNCAILLIIHEYPVNGFEKIDK